MVGCPQGCRMRSVREREREREREDYPTAAPGYCGRAAPASVRPPLGLFATADFIDKLRRRTMAVITRHLTNTAMAEGQLLVRCHLSDLSDICSALWTGRLGIPMELRVPVGGVLLERALRFSAAEVRNRQHDAEPISRHPWSSPDSHSPRVTVCVAVVSADSHAV